MVRVLPFDRYALNQAAGGRFVGRRHTTDDSTPKIRTKKDRSQMKATKPTLPSQDKRWKIVDAKMRRYGYQGHALIETLHAVQQSFGYLDAEALQFVATALHVPPSRVYGVSTFYNFFTLKPQGVHTCVVCLGTACYVKGAEKVLAAIEKSAGIKSGETTPDKQLSLLTVRCIGACAIAPAVVFDGNVSGKQTPQQAVEKLKGYIHNGA
jgi:bidirectional [NiFe] hydrogenase diaphorase subunit